MTDTQTLISRLSSEAAPMKPMASARYWGTLLLGLLIIYAIGAQIMLGLRPGLAAQFSRPLFTIEILLLVALFISSTMACVLSMYPDAYQKPRLLLLPYQIFATLVALLLFQLLIPQESAIAVIPQNSNGMECAICIASVALLPSAGIFYILRKGASVHQFQAGSLAVLAASSVGCLTLRLAEANDSVIHLTNGHYFPTFLFSIIGAYLGKWLLKW